MIERKPTLRKPEARYLVCGHRISEHGSKPGDCYDFPKTFAERPSDERVPESEETPMPTDRPATEAGRALYENMQRNDEDYGVEAILAIESEAQRLTVERLREAETLLADAQPNGMSIPPAEWQRRRAALAHPEEEQPG